MEVVVKSPELQKAIDTWIRYNKEKQFDEELNELLREGDEKTLSQLFLRRLDFGTAGLRGRMGCGFTRMNDVVVIQAAQGLLEYTCENIPDAAKRGILIGYDGRHLSLRFAKLTAAIFVNAQFRVYLFADVTPTPFVPFGMKIMKAAVGVMVTASHNPKDDNGYKVYWENFTQIISPVDKGIKNAIENNLEPRDTSWNVKFSKNNDDLICNPLEIVFEKYIERRINLAYDLTMNKNSTYQFTYTAMHGVGYKYLEEIFQRIKLKPVLPVIKQRDPDPDFPTVKFPNPEEGKSALDLAMKTANENGTTVILAHDPDADRFAVAEKLKLTNEWKIYTGNETGALIGWWLLHDYKKKNPNKTDLSDVYFISSTVSSKILRSIAKFENMQFEETLTGFKWMGNRADELMKQGKTVLFAFEESIGFMPDPECLDKDGVSTSCKAAELIIYLHNAGLTLFDKLQEIYDQYGQHLYASSYFFCYQKEIIEKIFNRLRQWTGGVDNNYPDSVGNGKYRVSGVRDLTAGYDSNMPDNKPVLPVSRSSQMITFSFENGFICTLRTSGTEPKIKYYSELVASPSQKDTKNLQQLLEDMLELVVQEFLQPELNNLVPRSD